MNLFRRKKKKKKYAYKKTYVDIIVCRLKGHTISTVWKWDWYRDIFGVRQRGKKIQMIYCKTCWLENTMVGLEKCYSHI